MIIKLLCKHTCAYTLTHSLTHHTVTWPLTRSPSLSHVHMHAHTLFHSWGHAWTHTHTHTSTHSFTHSILLTVTNLRPTLHDFTTFRYYCFSKASLHTAAHTVLYLFTATRYKIFLIWTPVFFGTMKGKIATSQLLIVDCC